MGILLVFLVLLALLNPVIAAIQGAPSILAASALAVAAVVLLGLQALPGPTQGWRTPSGAVSQAARPMPLWAAVAGALLIGMGLSAEVWILLAVWGPR